MADVPVADSVVSVQKQLELLCLIARIYGIAADPQLLRHQLALDEKSFPGFPCPKRNSLLVDGKQMPLTPGLNITAEIKTGRRSVLNYLLSPIQKTLDESVGER
ncbi:MAG: hemolysin activation protein [Pseudomonadota bacterium]